MSKKIMITTGGTGGHIYPAQGLAQQLSEKKEVSEILFIGGGLSTNRYFDKEQFPYVDVSCGPLVSLNPIVMIKGLAKLRKGVQQSIEAIKKFKPDVIVGFGSYYTLPALIASKLLGIPIILHEANSIPGKANKWFSRWAHCTGVHFPSTKQLLKGKVEEIALPLRSGYYNSTIKKKEALAHYNLSEESPTLLIFGGSQGAQAINKLLEESVDCPEFTQFQIIHITGNEEQANKFEIFYNKKHVKACVKAFEKNMDKAWKAADLFIGRSGASTIAEAMEFEIPGILIPFPHATDNHQEKNAQFLTDTVGGSITCLEKNLSGQTLIKHLLVINNSEHLAKMKEAMRQYKKKPSRLDLCEVVLDIADRSKKK